MGLAMVYGIVQNHGGSIEVESWVGHGTTFKIYLPLAKEPSARVETQRPPDVTVRGSGRILVVDDESGVRSVATELLHQLGYEVVTAGDGWEALETYREAGHQIDLVILDMVMPQLGGRECFRALRRINPGVKAVLSTGYGFDEAAQEILDEGMVGFIQKPYQMHQLSEAVANALKS